VPLDGAAGRELAREPLGHFLPSGTRPGRPNRLLPGPATVYRSITITLSPAATDELARALAALPAVVGLAVHRGTSLKSTGDQLVVEAFNSASDDVLERARAAAGGGALSATTSEAASLTDPSSQKLIDADLDEAVWEEMESRLLQEGGATPNFLALTAVGGVVAVAGLVSDPLPQAIALMSASVIAPGFEPLAKCPLGGVLGRWGLAGSGLRAAAVGYAVVILAALLVLVALVAAGAVTPEEFTANLQVQRLSALSPVDRLVSAGWPWPG
jgi:hypothetical protein